MFNFSNVLHSFVILFLLSPCRYLSLSLSVLCLVPCDWVLLLPFSWNHCSFYSFQRCSNTSMHSNNSKISMKYDSTYSNINKSTTSKRPNKSAKNNVEAKANKQDTICTWNVQNFDLNNRKTKKNMSIPS